MAKQVNGIEIETLQKTIDALKQDAELGKCQFRATNVWLKGTKNVGRVQSFYAAKQEMQHEKPFEAHADEPAMLAGEDSAANPVEQLLMSLAACVTTSMVGHAASRGIEIEELESELEGDIDLNGYFGLSSDVPKGFQQIRVRFRVRSNAEAEELRRLAEFSPVLNTLLNGTRVSIDVERQAPERARPPLEMGHP